MSRRFVTASQDASIYEAYDTVNAGFDEILEVGKVVKDLFYEPVRSLIKFEMPNDVPISASVFLNLRFAHAEDMTTDEVLEVYPMSASWVEGSGYFYQQVYNAEDGATWNAADSGSSWNTAGGDYLSSPSSSANLNTFPLRDLRIDVTDIVQGWISSSAFPNHGFMIKMDSTAEDRPTNQAIIKFFSKQTHTIYQPTLEFCWSEQTLDTGSLDPLTSTIVEIAPKNLPVYYTKGEVRKLYFNVRDKFPRKSFDGLQRFRNMYYLPAATQVEIRDAQSGMVVIPFDEYSTLDADVSGSYFLVDTTPMESYRFYDIRLKVTLGSEVMITEPVRVKVL